MTEFDILKLRSALLFIINKRGSIDIFHLFKILYFADREHMAKYGRRIINDTFCAFENGPAPTLLYDLIKSKNGKRLSRINREAFKSILDSFDRGTQDASNIVVSEMKPDDSYLSISDKECLDRAYEENINLSFGELSDKSHDSAWREVWNKCGRKNNRMNPYSSAKAAGAHDDTIKYMREMEEIQSFLMS